MKETEKCIKLEAAREEDYNDYYDIRCDESDIYWMGHTGKPDYEMLKAVFGERFWNSPLEKNGKRRIYMIKHNERAIGFVMLSNINGAIELGISIKSEYHRNGFGSKAIELAVNEARKFSTTVFARIRDDNRASQHVFKKNMFFPTEEYEINDYPKVGKVIFRKYLLQSQTDSCINSTGH